MRKFILTLLLFLPLITFGQPINNYSINWDGASNISPWGIVGANTFNVTNQWPCQGSHSIRVRLQGNQNQRSATIMSDKIGDASGGDITFSFDYKWLRYNSSLALAGNASELNMEWQWSNSTSGPWFTFATRDDNNHTESTNCTTVTTTFSAYPGELYVRLVASNTVSNGDNYLYIDNVNIQEGAPPTCFMPEDLYITNKTKT